MSWLPLFTSGGGGSSYADGYSGAPSGTIQYPSILNNYPSASPPGVRQRTGGSIASAVASGITQPPWYVAGVDYYVGVDSGVTLSNALTVANAGTIPGFSYSSTQGRYLLDAPDGSGGVLPIVLENLDFSIVDSGIYGATDMALAAYSLPASAIIRNCKFGLTTIQYNYACPITVTKCTSLGDPTGAHIATNDAFLWPGSTLTGGTLEFTYNYLINSHGQVMSVSNCAGTTYKYNLIVDSGTNPGAHVNYVQFNGPGPNNNVDIQFNTFYQHVMSAGGEGVQLIDANTVPGDAQTFNSPILRYNTYVWIPSGATPCLTYPLHHTNVAAQFNTPTIDSNYYDPSGGYSMTHFSYTFATENTPIYNPAINLLDGTTFAS